MFIVIGVDNGLVAAALAQVRAGVDALLAVELTGLDSVAVVDLLKGIEVERRRLDAVDVRVVCQAQARWVAGEYGQSSTAEVLMQAVRIAPVQARRRAERAGELGPRRTVCGEGLPALFAHVAAALAEGVISVEHADVIRRELAAVDRIPGLDPAAGEVAEKLLVEAARHEAPRVVAMLGVQLRDRLDPDGREPRERELERTRHVSIGNLPDGWGKITGIVAPEVRAALETILDALGAPQPAAEGMPDDRTPGQRRHDAVGEMCRRLLGSASLPSAGGTPVTVLVRVDRDDFLAAARTGHGTPDPTGWAPAALTGWAAPGWGPADPEAGAVIGAAVRAARDTATHDAATHDAGRGGVECGGAGHLGGIAGRTGSALTGHGELLSLSRLMFASCEAELVTIVTNDTGAVLALGRARRTASYKQRLALAARDGGCCFPGCTRPASWCEAHHVIPWRLGGLTNLANLCLLCRFHHREFEKRGWTVVMNDGMPEWLPPPWLDPTGKPLRNTAHHPPDFDFAYRGAKLDIVG